MTSQQTNPPLSTYKFTAEGILGNRPAIVRSKSDYNPDTMMPNTYEPSNVLPPHYRHLPPPSIFHHHISTSPDLNSTLLDQLANEKGHPFRFLICEKTISEGFLPLDLAFARIENKTILGGKESVTLSEAVTHFKPGTRPSPGSPDWYHVRAEQSAMYDIDEQTRLLLSLDSVRMVFGELEYKADDKLVSVLPGWIRAAGALSVVNTALATLSLMGALKAETWSQKQGEEGCKSEVWKSTVFKLSKVLQESAEVIEKSIISASPDSASVEMEAAPLEKSDGLRNKGRNFLNKVRTKVTSRGKRGTAHDDERETLVGSSIVSQAGEEDERVEEDLYPEIPLDRLQQIDPLSSHIVHSCPEDAIETWRASSQSLRNAVRRSVGYETYRNFEKSWGEESLGQMPKMDVNGFASSKRGAWSRYHFSSI